MEVKYLTRADQMKEMIRQFAQKHLSEVLAEKAVAMLKCVQRNRRLNFFKGDMQVWVAAIIFEIARLNFLFDKDSAYHITPELISRDFRQKKTTILNKVQKIEKACQPQLGDQRYCDSMINSVLKFYTTSSGFVVHKLHIDSCLQNLQKLDPLEAAWFKNKIDEKIKIEKEKHLEKIRKKAERKKVVVKNQLDLFD